MALDFFAGCVGGCAGVLVGYPLDTVKVHIQTQNTAKPLYRGTFHCLKSLAATKGIRGLYSGMSSPLASVACVNALVFGIYGNVQRQLPNPDSLSAHFIAGSIAGLVQSPISSIMELVKTRSQLSTKKSTPYECFKQIYKQLGVKGLFRGNLVTILREVPSFGSYFYTYEFLVRYSSTEVVSTPMMLMAGGLAGTASWVFTYPIDVIKSRLQADGANGFYKYSSMLDCLKQSVKHEGTMCLFRGLNSTIVRAFPTNAACFTVVMWTMRLLDGKTAEHTIKPPSVQPETPVKKSKNKWISFGSGELTLTEIQQTA